MLPISIFESTFNGKSRRIVRPLHHGVKWLNHRLKWCWSQKLVDAQVNAILTIWPEKSAKKAPQLRIGVTRRLWRICAIHLLGTSAT